MNQSLTAEKRVEEQVFPDLVFLSCYRPEKLTCVVWLVLISIITNNMFR